VSAFRIEGSSGKLTLLNQQASGGTGPCHVAVDATGKCVLLANYGSGSIAALPLNKDGSLGAQGCFIQHEGSSVNQKRQAGPHAHFILPDPSNSLALACDLGLDKVMIYDLSPSKASLTPHTPTFATVKPGAGPRHFVFRPDSRFVYVVNEMGSSVTAFTWDKKAGSMQEVQMVSTLPAGFKGDNTCAEIQVHPSGKYVYASNRGHDSIALFAIGKDGKLTAAGHTPTQGQGPRNFVLDPSGKWLLAANQRSNNIVLFRVDGKSGKLTPDGQVLQATSPVCIRFL
jgi:6-phosphogluconolactonase